MLHVRPDAAAQSQDPSHYLQAYYKGVCGTYLQARTFSPAIEAQQR